MEVCDPHFIGRLGLTAGRLEPLMRLDVTKASRWGIYSLATLRVAAKRILGVGDLQGG